jgi:hypothetical protein
MSAVPPASPSLYIPFGARQPIASKAYDSYDEFEVPSESEPPFAGTASDSASESPPTQQQGVFVSEAELLALKQWAARTEEELKQQVTARDEEMRVLRDRLAASEAALRAAQRKDGARQRDLEVAEEDEDVPFRGGASSRHASARRSSRETNALALELSSRRRAEGSARRRAESSKLQSEWRAARTALASVKAPDESAKAVAADAEGS